MTFSFFFLLVLQEGLAECIANEDGERQIACAISFHGEEMASFSETLPTHHFTRTVDDNDMNT